MKKLDLGIRNKVIIGFIIIGLMLFLSGVVAFFEFGRMSRRVSVLISENITSVNTSRSLINLSDEYNSNILEEIGDVGMSEMPDLSADEGFMGHLEDLSSHFANERERAMVDSIRYAYVSYIHLLQEMENIWHQGYVARRDLYFNKMQTVHDKLRGYIQRLSQMSQTALADNYQNLEASFYRSIMPGIIAVAAGIVLVVLFNYFINIFILIPLIKINKALKNYQDYNKSYDVKFDYGEDQIQYLNESIRDLVDENKSLKRK